MAAITPAPGLGFAAGMIPLPLVTAEALRGTLADMTQLGFS
jgi:hypothetical protein